MGDDVAGNIIQTQLYLMPPRQVSVSTNVDPTEQLWLLPLVDVRYWWQFINCGDWGLTSSTTWAQLFTAIGNALNVTINNDIVPAAYLGPDAVEFYRRNDNIAVYLNAVASCVGQRIVRSIDGTVSSQSAATATATYTANLTLDNWTQSAGGDFGAQVGNFPAQVTVSYPKYRQGVPYCEGSQQTYSNTNRGHCQELSRSRQTQPRHFTRHALPTSLADRAFPTTIASCRLWPSKSQRTITLGSSPSTTLRSTR